ncbi:MAG TPA: hypothetical protein V6D21_22090 [Candidatus Obscuribacterales bacterium]
MESTIVDNFFILNLFTKLRQAGLPLIFDDYEDALNILANPAPVDFNLDTVASVIQLCRRLWVKSLEQDRIFETCLEEVKPQSSIKKLKRKKVVETGEKLTSPVLEPKSTASPTQTIQKPSQPEPTEKIVIKAIARITKPDDRYTRIKVGKTYLPVSRQQMQQNWLTLHSPQFASNPIEIDIEATLRDIEKEGIFFELVMIPPQQPSLELLLLIDRQGSMVPFHGLARQLVKTAVQGGHLGKIDCYYFENHPDREFYRDPECWEGKQMGWVLSRLHPERTAVLIFSDAGAARGKFSLERLDATEEFLWELKSRCRNIVWVNPLPKRRWQKTTAEYIAKLTHLVTMFECDRVGWEKAIEHLQQKNLPSRKLRSSLTPLKKGENSERFLFNGVGGSNSLSSERGRKTS